MPSKAPKHYRLYGYESKEPPAQRSRLSEFYNTHRWKKERKAFLQSHPLCEECNRKGRLRAANIVDHIIPPPIVDFWNKTNWQALCQKCNIAKGGQDRKMLQEYNQNKKG